MDKSRPLQVFGKLVGVIYGGALHALHAVGTRPDRKAVRPWRPQSPRMIAASYVCSEDSHLVAQQADKRQPVPSHEAVAQKQQPPALHLGVEILCIKVPQGAVVRREDLTVLRIYECGAGVIYPCASTLPAWYIPTAHVYVYASARLCRDLQYRDLAESSRASRRFRWER